MLSGSAAVNPKARTIAPVRPPRVTGGVQPNQYRKEVSQVIYEIAMLQIEERQREVDRESLARLARPDRTLSQKLSMLQRIARSRRRVVAPIA